MDADGDLTVVYQGFGPDASDSLKSGAAVTLLRTAINAPENADLLAAWPQLATTVSLPMLINGTGNSGDTDSVIEQILIEAQKNHNFTDIQLGRLRAILDQVASLLRGEGNGIMYSQFDADPRFAQHILASDNVVNSQRDGTNTRVLIALDKRITGGKFEISLLDNAAMVEDDDVVDFGDQGDPPVPVDPATMLADIEGAERSNNGDLFRRRLHGSPPFGQ